MKKHSLFFILLGILSVQLGFAQQKTITGTVTDENGVPLPGATALIENTSRGVTTDFDGNFAIEVEVNEVLIVSYFGYADQKITIGPADTYAISLQPGNQLEQVVVTSLGISREKKSLGYAQQSVQGETLVQSKEVDLNITLSGNGIPVRNGYAALTKSLNEENYNEAISIQGPDNQDTRLWWDIK